MSPDRPYRRTQYLVDRGYQLRFITRSLMSIGVVAFISAMVATLVLWRNMYRPEFEQQTHIIAALIGVAVVLLLELLIAIPILYFLGLRQSHQVVGPIKRITRMLEAIGSGDFSQRLILREGDVLEDVADAINRMTESLQKRYPSSSQ